MRLQGPDPTLPFPPSPVSETALSHPECHVWQVCIWVHSSQMVPMPVVWPPAKRALRPDTKVMSGVGLGSASLSPPVLTALPCLPRGKMPRTTSSGRLALDSLTWINRDFVLHSPWRSVLSTREENEGF